MLLLFKYQIRLIVALELQTPQKDFDLFRVGEAVQIAACLREHMLKCCGC